MVFALTVLSILQLEELEATGRHLRQLEIAPILYLGGLRLLTGYREAAAATVNFDNPVPGRLETTRSLLRPREIL